MRWESGEAAGEDGQRTAIGEQVLRSPGLGVGGSGGGGEMREWGRLVRAALGEKARAGHPSPVQGQPRGSQAV